jgi:AcrR family transcriptional regulator
MTSPGVRERLARAAFELFDERGYEQTTVDHIAERAGVGRTTFFRHFPSKEDVIFPDHDVVRKAIEERLAASTQETALVAVSEAARLVLRHYLAEGARARSRYQLTSTVSTLRDREIASVPQYQRLFRSYIHQWMGGEPQTALRAELMAAAVVTAHNVVLRRWLQAKTEQPEAEFDQAMEQVFGLYFDTTAQDVAETRSSILVLRTMQDLEALLPKLRKALREP